MRMVQFRYDRAELVMTSYAQGVWTERGDGKSLGEQEMKSAIDTSL